MVEAFPVLAAVSGPENHGIVAHRPAQVLVMKEDSGQGGTCRNFCLTPGLAVVLGKKDMTPLPNRHQTTLYGHAIQEKRAPGEGRLERVLKLVWRAVLSETAGRKTAEKRQTDEDHQGAQGDDHS